MSGTPTSLLTRVARKPPAAATSGGADPFATDAFPFNVPAVRALTALDTSAPVTFFVGENGSGKSTLLEAIAAAAELPTLGSDEVAFEELDHVRLTRDFLNDPERYLRHLW